MVADVSCSGSFGGSSAGCSDSSVVLVALVPLEVVSCWPLPPHWQKFQALVPDSHIRWDRNFRFHQSDIFVVCWVPDLVARLV